MLLNYVEYEVKEEYTDNHVADKHSKAGHMFDEEMADVGKFGDVEMHEAATHTFQGMSNEVQSDKLDEEQDTTTGAHEGVNDRKEESDHEVLPDQQDVDKDNPDKDQQDIDKDQQDGDQHDEDKDQQVGDKQDGDKDQQDGDKQDGDKDQQGGVDDGKDHKGEVDDDLSLPEKKDGDKDPIIEGPKVETGGNKLLKEEDPKVDTGVSAELLEECVPDDGAMHKAQFLGDKDAPTIVDVNEHTPGDDDALLAEMFCFKKKLSRACVPKTRACKM